MENEVNLPKFLVNGVQKLVSQKEAVAQSRKYIEDRRSGKTQLIKSCYSRLNDLIGGGFEANTIIALSGLSGGGKSTLSKRLLYSFLEDRLSQNKGCIGLSFNFEMLAHKTIGRELANREKQSLRTLYSSTETLDEAYMNYVFNTTMKNIAQLPIFYIETPQNYSNINLNIKYYWDHLCKEENKLLVVEIDHTLIVRGNEGDREKDKIDNLMSELNDAKKYIANQGGEVIFLVLSQMNRDIKDIDRLKHASMHFPMTSDLMASSALEFYSDYIIIAHNPGKLSLSSYSEEKYPITVHKKFINKDGIEDEYELPLIYFHLLKNRDGEPDLFIPMIGNFRYFEFEQISREQFVDLCTQFRATKKCFIS